MASILDGELTSLAFCWRLERADGAGIALTSSDRAMSAGGMPYQSAPGVTPASITRKLGLEPDSGEIAGALSSDCLSEGDLALGRWDGAAISLWVVDWRDPEGAVVPLLAGTLGEVSVEDQSFSAELRGAASRLSDAPCPSTSPECRASFGDNKCRVDLARRTMRAKVVGSGDNAIELDRQADSRFLFGRLRFLSGENCGLASTILSASENRILLRDRPREAIEVGAVVELREGCDKRFETCVGRFGNAANFRGEPHLPGTDLLTRYPGG